MPLTWTLDAGPATTMVTVDGTPTAASMSTLRTRLAADLARRPVPLLISVSALSAKDPKLFPVIAALAGGMETPIVLQCEDYEPRVPLSRALSAARKALLSEHRIPRTRSEQLLPMAGAARHSRDIATESCLRWDLPHLVGPAAMVASELTTYAARNAGTLMSLTIATSAHAMYLALQHGRPVPEPPGLPAGRGRHHRSGAARGQRRRRLLGVPAAPRGRLPLGRDHGRLALAPGVSTTDLIARVRARPAC
jgi:hypothetical protein